MIRALLRRLIFWRAKTPTVETPTVAKQDRRKDTEEQGRWYFRRDILERLDDYMYFAKKLRRTDHEAYNYVSKVGAILGSENALNERTLSPRWRKEGPNIGAGALAFPSSYDDKTGIVAKFIYFRRINNRPPALQPTNARDIYYVILFYSERRDDRKFDKYAWPLCFHVGITHDGEMMLLKEKQATQQLFKPHGKRTAQRALGRVTHHSMGVPSGVLTAARDHNMDVDKWVKFCATYAMVHYENASMDLIVRAKKGNTTAAFSVDLLRTPYFFKDREFVPASDGRRKRIFHIVRVHERNTKHGRTYVRTHFRGMRRFNWNGYKVSVGMPGKHIGDMLDFNVGTEVFDGPKIPDGYVGSGKMAQIVAEGLDT